MYQVLIVDDEIYAVKGIVDGIGWEHLAIAEVHEAYNAQQAKKILQEHPIDVMICDIEMPVMNGLSLLEWANTEFPDLKTVFLTSHAEFSYAQRAMQLGSKDYMLKPVIYEEMEEVIAKNLKELQDKRNHSSQTETFKKYYQLWHEQKPEWVQTFWRDVMNGTGDWKQQKLEQAIRAYDLPLSEKDHLRLILLSIEEWTKPLNAHDEELMGYALRKAAEEIIIPDQAGHIIEDELGNLIIIIYLRDHVEKGDSWKLRCEAYMEACQQYFFCHVSCYIGNVSAIAEMSLRYHELLEMEFRNVTRHHQVIVHAEHVSQQPQSEQMSFLKWTESLESGNLEQIKGYMAETYDWIRDHQGRKEALTTVFHGVLQVVYYVLLRKGISPDTLSRQGVASDPQEVTRSSVHVQMWMEGMIKAVLSLTDPGSEDQQANSIVLQIQSYIHQHINQDITRDDLSALVHLNPSYLSRLFRLKTGTSITEYMLHERMNRASDLLASTQDTISSIAMSLGYDNFSYFSKMFKKVHNVTPQEFRRARDE
ncbi:response regulator transcription factor [Paenibacillus qinlingensis]|uniref:response regulator transcription factor n=1 Tax=Paenibacillus qinlingensis TaxID=1837343 RepID=UPI001564C164|nr:response regulator [Paenibacillus qinlingensis]NQX58685.1 response regulator [Paenibacillus qinlingensis]